MKPDISKTNMYEITGCGFDSQRGRGISKFSLEKSTFLDKYVENLISKAFQSNYKDSLK